MDIAVEVHIELELIRGEFFFCLFACFVFLNILSM